MNYDLFIKVLGLTTSDQEGEALAAIRKANAMLKAHNLTWRDVVSPGRVRATTNSQGPQAASATSPRSGFTQDPYPPHGFHRSETASGPSWSGPTGDESASAYEQRRNAQWEERRRRDGERMKEELRRAQQQREEELAKAEKTRQEEKRRRHARFYDSTPGENGRPPDDADWWSSVHYDIHSMFGDGVAESVLPPEWPSKEDMQRNLANLSEMLLKLSNHFPIQQLSMFSWFAVRHFKEAEWLYRHWNTNIMANSMLQRLMKGEELGEPEIKIIRLAMGLDSERERREKDWNAHYGTERWDNS